MSSIAPLSVPDAIVARHAVRSYTDEPVSDADVDRILTLTGLAPSAFNAQPWRFVVVRDADTKLRLKEAANGQAQVGAAPVVLVLYTDMADTLDHVDEVIHPELPEARREATRGTFARVFGSKTPAERENWAAEQTFIALGFLLLAAQSLGYATSPMAGFDPAKVKAVLGLPEHARVPAMVAMGRPADGGFSSHRHGIERITRRVG